MKHEEIYRDWIVKGYCEYYAAWLTFYPDQELNPSNVDYMIWIQNKHQLFEPVESNRRGAKYQDRFTEYLLDEIRKSET